MFVRIDQSATAEQIAAIRSRATEAGLAVYDEASERGLTLALLGPKGFDEKLSDEFVGMPGVASVARPSRAYRLSSQEFREEPTIVKVRDAVIGGGSLTLMAGPCSIESRDQLLEVAAGVAAAGAQLLPRGGFKPRPPPDALPGLSPLHH